MEQLTLADGQTVTMLDMLESARIQITQTLADELKRKYFDTHWTGYLVVYDPFSKTKWHFGITEGRVTDRRALLGVEYPHLHQDAFTLKETAAAVPDGEFVH